MCVNFSDMDYEEWRTKINTRINERTLDFLKMDFNISRIIKFIKIGSISIDALIEDAFADVPESEEEYQYWKTFLLEKDKNIV